MISGLIIFTAVSTAIAAQWYRLGLWLMLVVGLISDPIRKLTPDTPVIISIAFVPIFAAILFKVASMRSREESIFRSNPSLRSPFRWFLFFFCINAVRPLIENPAFLPLVLYSITQYAGLFAAIFVGYHLMDREEDLLKYAKIYLVTVTPFLLSAIPHFLGYQEQWPALRTMKFADTDYLVFTGQFNAIAINGLFRTPEQLGWHAMTGTCCAFLLLLKRRSASSFVMQRAAYLLSASLGIFCMIVSVRRKFFFGIFIFFLIYLLLLLRKNKKRAVSALLVVLIVGGIGSLCLDKMQESERSRSYAGRIRSSAESVKDEAYGRALGSIHSALRRYGFFGRGLGTTAQGPDLGVSMVKDNWNIEPGPGKIVSELGIPGALAFLILICGAFFSAYKNLRLRALGGDFLASYAFLIAVPGMYAISAAVSHQTYADPFVAAITGMSFGFMLAAPKICDNNTLKSKIMPNAPAPSAE